MRTVFFIGLCFVWSGVTAQTVLPNWLIDSMTYEVKLGRACNDVMKAQADEIQKLGAELVATNTALKLTESKSLTLESLLMNQKESKEILTQQFNLDRKKLKRKIRKRNAFIVLEAVALGVVLLL